VKGAETEKAAPSLRNFLLMETGMSKLVSFTGYRKYLISLAIIISIIAALVPVVSVFAAPAIDLIPSSGAVGITVIVTGTVFESYAGDNVRVFFDTMEIRGSPFAVPSNGTFSIEFVIPAGTVPGQHWLEVRSQTSSALLAKALFIVNTPSLKLSPAEGPVGTEVEISGSGFYAGKPVNISYYNPSADKIGSETASDTGEFVQRFTIPPGTGNFHAITASNTQGNVAETSFKILPGIKLNLTSAGPREPVKINGVGFTGNSGVVIYFDTLAITSTSTDVFGSFEVEFKVPEVKSISYDVKSQDSKGLQDEAAFAVTAGVSLSSALGSAGEKIVVRGTGFIAGASISVSFNEQPIAAGVADNNGDFNITMTIPSNRGGEHIITISDGTTSKRLGFSIEKSPPPVPVLVLPLNDSLTKAEAYFQWQAVWDSSTPVTYILQIASNQNFSAIVLQKTGLTSSEYALSEAETLAADFKSAAYFWRIKAIDGALNESDWTNPWVFYVSVPPSPALLQPAAEGTVKLPIRFNWQSVSSLSPPVTYNLELASDLGFTSILLDKTGLTVPDYLVSKEHKLKLKNNVIYYWRVKAVDNARNASEWSETGSFTFSGPGFPVWAIYILIFLAAAIAVLIAFRWGRKTAYH
jgi:hypothetical protein